MPGTEFTEAAPPDGRTLREMAERRKQELAELRKLAATGYGPDADALHAEVQADDAKDRLIAELQRSLASQVAENARLGQLAADILREASEWTIVPADLATIAEWRSALVAATAPPAEAAATTPGQACRLAYGAEVARALGMDWPGPGVDITGPGGDPVFAAGWEAGAQAVLDRAFPGLKRERDEAREQLATARKDLASTEKADERIVRAVTAERDRLHVLVTEILDELDQWELLVEDDRRDGWRKRAALGDGGTT